MQSMKLFKIAGAALLISSQFVWGGDWPQWRGPNRDGKSTDKGLLKDWPSQGPPLAWRANGLGKGFASVAVVGKRIYTMGDKDDGSYLIALDANGGKPIWSTKVGAVGAPGWGGFTGPRCTPTV